MIKEGYKNIVIISIILFSFFVLIFIPTSFVGAISLFKPFGGRILSTNVPGIKCPGSTGPIIVMPLGNSPASLYISTPTTKKYNYNNLLAGEWILGLYSPIQLPLCVTETTPPTVVNAYPIMFFGTSNLTSF